MKRTANGACLPAGRVQRTVQNVKFKAFLVLLCSFALLSGCQEKPLHRELRILMGTFVEVVSPDKGAAGVVFGEIKRVEGLLSKYKHDSEVSRLNASGLLSVSKDTLFVIKKSKEFWRLSGGTFDISVGPLMDLWGFTDRNFRIPTKEEIENALMRVGFDKIVVDETQSVVKLSVPGMRIDLGAVAKGFAVDCAVRRLKEKGIKSCVINAGGDIYCLGGRFRRPWTIAVQHPRSRQPAKYVNLKDSAIATSGDYEQYFVKDNKKYSHIMDPRSGFPAAAGAVSITVVAPDCLTADALATTLFVLGREKGEELLKKFPGTRAIFIEEKDVAPLK